MATLDPLLELAGTCLNNGVMPAAWDRLARLVVARRVELGYKSRPRLTEDAAISLRTLADIEIGRRESYDASTLAALEQALRWASGSVAAILAGGDPIEDATPRHHRRTIADNVGLNDSVAVTVTPAQAASRQSEALIRVMDNPKLTSEDKKKIVRLLRAEQEAFERGRVARADELARLFEGES